MHAHLAMILIDPGGLGLQRHLQLRLLRERLNLAIVTALDARHRYVSGILRLHRQLHGDER